MRGPWQHPLPRVFLVVEAGLSDLAGARIAEGDRSSIRPSRSTAPRLRSGGRFVSADDQEGSTNLIGIEVELLLWNDAVEGDHQIEEDRSNGI